MLARGNHFPDGLVPFHAGNERLDIPLDANGVLAGGLSPTTTLSPGPFRDSEQNK